MNSKISFGINLKQLRERNHLTQKELAKEIGYTEKSISKWETGCGLPTMEIAVQLADYFSVTLDELMYSSNSARYLLAIDGGGTKTIFVLADDSGKELRRVCKSSTNPNDIGLSAVLKILDEGIREICHGVLFRHIVLFAGLSGAGLTGNYRETIHKFFSDYGFYAFDNGSDIDSLIGLVNQNSCILVIMGTGFITYCLDGDEQRRIGGWGQLFDEGGSGYSIGRDAISAALSHLDKSGRPTILTEMIMQRIGGDIPAHLTEFYTGGKQYIASFSELVFLAAEQNDVIACAIIEKNMQYVSDKLQAALKEYSNPVPVYFAGGISRKHELLFPAIKHGLVSDSVELIYMEDEPVAGALMHAKKLLNEKRGV